MNIYRPASQQDIFIITMALKTLW